MEIASSTIIGSRFQTSIQTNYSQYQKYCKPFQNEVPLQYRFAAAIGEADREVDPDHHRQYHAQQRPCVALQVRLGAPTQVNPQISFAKIANPPRRQYHGDELTGTGAERAGGDHEYLERERHERHHGRDEYRQQTVAREPLL